MYLATLQINPFYQKNDEIIDSLFVEQVRSELERLK